MAYQITKLFQNTAGVDLRSSDLLRSQGAATEALNVEYRQTGALNKRKGWTIKGSTDVGGAGSAVFSNVNLTSGAETKELLVMDDNLHKYIEDTFTLTYTGSTEAYYNMELNSSDGYFYFNLYEDNVLVSSTSLGTGYDSGDRTVTQLVTILNAVTNFTCTLSGSGSNKAAFIDQATVVAVPSTGLAINYYYYSQITTPNGITNPFSAHFAKINDSEFENASSAQINDIMLISNGYDELHKYDGLRVYRAGLPRPTTPTNATTGAGSLGIGSYLWKYIYTYTDAKENQIESRPSETTEFDNSGGAGTESRDITLSYVQNTSGFNTDQATINGNQVGVTTITVSSPHYLQTGDYVYINDGVTSSIVRKKITGTTSTTIDIDGDAVNVTDTEIISCIKISLLRTSADGTLFFIEKEFINDVGSSTFSYTSTTADSSLTVDFIEHAKFRDLPPKARYIDVWRSQVVLTGINDDVNNVYYSDIDGPEYFTTDNSFYTLSRLGGANSGLKSLDNTLFIFKEQSTFTVSGDFATDNFRVDTLSDAGIGCVANATIYEISGKVWFLGNHGIYSVNPQGVQIESDPVEPRFSSKATFTKKRSVGFYDIEQNYYMVLLPELLENGSNVLHLDTTSSVMVKDLYRNAWLEWNNINMLAGAVEYNSSIYKFGKNANPSTGNLQVFTSKNSSFDTENDYHDQGAAISFSYKSHWESMGEPSIPKKFLRIKVHSLDGSIDDFETNIFSIDVETEHDFQPATESQLTLDFSGGALGWGESPWGSYPWSEDRLTDLKSKLASKKAKAIRVIFKNSNILENILISGYELEVAAPYDMALK